MKKNDRTQKFPAREVLQEELQREINASVFKPFSFEIYKKTPEEKVRLSVEKSKHKNQLKIKN